MIKVMFVCHGNICRSPTAEVILRDLVEKAGLGDKISVSSSATSEDEIFRGKGNPVYPQAEAELNKHGLTGLGKTARKLQRNDYDEYSLFIGMDSENIREIMRIFGQDNKGKVHKLSEYCSQIGDVDDPWYSRRFDIAYRDISCGCIGLLNELRSNYKL